MPTKATIFEQVIALCRERGLIRPDAVVTRVTLTDEDGTEFTWEPPQAAEGAAPSLRHPDAA